MNFFKTKQRTPPDLVRGLRDNILKLESSPPGDARKKVCAAPRSAHLADNRGISSNSIFTRLYTGERGDQQALAADQRAALWRWRCAVILNASNLILTCIIPYTEPVPELLAQLAQETYSTDLLYFLVLHIGRFDFEARKDAVQIFNNLLRRQIGTRWPTVEYISSKREVLFAALQGYENEEVALNTGMILREMLKHEQLCKILLHSEQCVNHHRCSSKMLRWVCGMLK